MRHRKSGRRLGRNGPHRKAMMRNMVASLILHGRIRTTDTRAKELRIVAENLITIGKRGLRDSEVNRELSDEAFAQKRVHLYRQILRDIKDKDIARRVFDYAEIFSERSGGYTRTLKLGNRLGDNAPVSMIEFVQRIEEEADAE